MQLRGEEPLFLFGSLRALCMGALVMFTILASIL